MNLQHVQKAAEQLAKIPEDSYITTCASACDFFSQAVFRANKHLYGFQTQQLGGAPGLQCTSISHILRAVKREMASPVISGTEWVPNKPQGNLR